MNSNGNYKSESLIQDVQEEKPAPPSLDILAQYTKDLSFENPEAPGILFSNAKPHLDINVNIKAQALAKTDYEVALEIQSKAYDGDKVVLNLEFVYAGAFRILNVPEEYISAALFIECPRLLFPFARQIVSDLTRNGGYPPLLINPIDFAGLYQKRLEEEKAAQQASVGENPSRHQTSH